MMKNRRFMMMAALGMILCLVMSVGLTACGGQTEAPAEEPAAEEPAEPEATEPAAEETAEPETTTEPEAADQQDIGEQQAAEIALKDAGVSADEATNVIVGLDYDDDTGRQEYEVKFYVGTTEYEYTLDAATGDILEKDIDND